MACACGCSHREQQRTSAGGDCLGSGGEFLMFDLIRILGITLRSAGLIGAPCRHHPKPCGEEDTRASPRAGLLLQEDTLSTARGRDRARATTPERARPGDEEVTMP